MEGKGPVMEGLNKPIFKFMLTFCNLGGENYFTLTNARIYFQLVSREAAGVKGFRGGNKITKGFYSVIHSSLP